MSDFDNVLRSAVDAATGATVAPSFAVVERRMRVRRRHQIATVATGVTVVLAGGALAVPRIEARNARPAHDGGLRPFEGYRSDRDAHGVYTACVARRPASPPADPDDVPTLVPPYDAGCLREAGYEPPASQEPVYVVAHTIEPKERARVERCTGNFEFGTPPPRTETVAEGQTDLGRWWVFVADTFHQDKYPCVGFRAGQHGWGLGFVDAGDVVGDPGRQQFGGVSDNLSWGSYDFDNPTHVAFWGAVSDQADHVDFTVNGETHTVPAVASKTYPGWRYVGTVFDVGHPDAWEVVVYDATGKVLARYPD